MSKTSKNSPQPLSKPVAVHLHLYYTDMWDELCTQLKNLGNTPHRLFVTLVKTDKQLEENIKHSFPDAEVWVVENMGYDIGPFIEFLNRINPDEYSYILKLHSKRPSNGTDTKLNHLPVNRYYWKVLLSQALIGSPQIWEKNLLALEQAPHLGMIASPHLIKRADSSDESLLPQVKENLQHLGLPEISKFSFVAGTMFLVRSELFKILRGKYTIQDFQTTDGQVKDGTFAHVFERLFGAVISAQGYDIKGFDRNYKFVCSAVGKIILRFFYQKKITKHNKMLLKICKIPVFEKNL